MGPRLPLVLSLAGVLLAATALAEPLGRHFEITPFGGFTFFDGQQRIGGNILRDNLYIGGRLGYQFHRLLAIEVAGGFTPTTEDVAAGADVDFYHASGNVLFTPWQGLYGGPFLMAGGGMAQINPSGGSGEDNSALEVGGGVRFWLTDALGLRFEIRQVYYKTDVGASTNVHINHLVAGGGVVLAFGARGRDTDLDGVADRKDACPDTPRGARVDARGCPLDSDGDQVLDGLDQCAGTPAGCVVDKNGCPVDGDGDGVCDGVDQCADTPRGATVDAKGCPRDSDGDGVLDGLDQCPGSPAGAKVDEKGCPNDDDGDGVVNGLDQCPETSPGLKVDAQGCPIEVMEKETELLDTGMIRLSNVNFETAKAEILAESHAVLDVVGQVLRKWPELNIEIGGHTDARGSNAYNQRLSEARAAAVRSYLVTKFPDLKAEQFTVKGYGESRALVPNNSALNMAKNRRVEFVVTNKDVLKREVERRRLLRKDEAAPAPAPAPVDTLVTPPSLPPPTPIAPPDTTTVPPDTTGSGKP